MAAGDDPDGLCGWLTIAPIDITTMEETQGALDIDTIERTTFVNDRISSFYWQDQIDVTSGLARPGEKSEAPGVELEPEEMDVLIAQNRAGWNTRVQGAPRGR